MSRLGPVIVCYSEPADQDRFAPQEAARFYERESRVLVARSATIPFTHVCSGRWDDCGPRVALDTALPRLKSL